MNTSSPTRNPSQSCTPHFSVTRSPTTTSFSTNTPSQMLQKLPTCAPGNTCAKAQIRVPSPTLADSHRPFGWTKTGSVMALSGEVVNRLRDRERTVLRVLVGARDVRPDDPEPEDQHEPDEQDRQH